MAIIATLVICLAGYVAFTKTRSGADVVGSIVEATLLAALFSAMLGGVACWLSGGWMSDFADFPLTMTALSFTFALLGALVGSLKPRREPLPHW